MSAPPHAAMSPLGHAMAWAQRGGGWARMIQSSLPLAHPDYPAEYPQSTPQSTQRLRTVQSEPLPFASATDPFDTWQRTLRRHSGRYSERAQVWAG